MTCTLSIATASPSDFHISGPYPFTVGAIATGEDVRVSAYVKFLGNEILRKNLTKAVDHGTRIPGEYYALRLREAPPGDYTVSFVATSNGQVQTKSVAVRVFPKPDYTCVVTSTEELVTELANILAGGYAHAKVVIRGAPDIAWSGEMPDLSNSDTLISFEGSGGDRPKVTISQGSPKIKWGYWYWINFSAAGATAFPVASKTVQVFEKCSFQHSAVGLSSKTDSYVRMEDCHLNSLATGVIGANIIRGMSWEIIDKVVFQDCLVVDGTIGSRVIVPASLATSQAIARIFSYSRPPFGFVVRNNVVVGDYSQFIEGSSSCANGVICGNSVSTSAPVAIDLPSMAGCYVARNTINHTGSKETIASIGNTTDNIVINNYFTRLGSGARKLVDTGVWAANATLSSVSFGDVIVLDEAPFQNNYLFLQPQSKLRFSAVADSNTDYVQGVATGTHVGALPYHPDVNLASTYQNVLRDPDFNYLHPAVSA